MGSFCPLITHQQRGEINWDSLDSDLDTVSITSYPKIFSVKKSVVKKHCQVFLIRAEIALPQSFITF